MLGPKEIKKIESGEKIIGCESDIKALRDASIELNKALFAAIESEGLALKLMSIHPNPDMAVISVGQSNGDSAYFVHYLPPRKDYTSAYENAGRGMIWPDDVCFVQESK